MLRPLIVISLLSVGATAQAQSPPAPSQEQQAARAAIKQSCAADLKSYCAGKKGHEAMMCLRSNEDKVSTGCKDAMAKMPKPTTPPH